MVTEAAPAVPLVAKTPAALPETPVVAQETTTSIPVAEAPAAATPVETPTPVAPVPVAPVIPPISPEILRYDAMMEERGRAVRQQDEQRVLQETTDRYAQALAQEAVAAYGVTYDAVLPFVQKIARQQGDIVYRQYQADQSRQLQQNAAFAIAKEHGADLRTIALLQSILGLGSTDAMRQAAVAATAQTTQATEMARLKAEIETLKKGQVPAQTFASPGGAANQVADNSNIDALYMGWERANPNSERVNPYQAQYRKFLYGA